MLWISYDGAILLHNISLTCWPSEQAYLVRVPELWVDLLKYTKLNLAVASFSGPLPACHPTILQVQQAGRWPGNKANLAVVAA